jgi:hypothetical protein
VLPVLPAVQIFNACPVQRLRRIPREFEQPHADRRIQRMHLGSGELGTVDPLNPATMTGVDRGEIRGSLRIRLWRPHRAGTMPGALEQDLRSLGSVVPEPEALQTPRQLPRSGTGVRMDPLGAGR